ncbi:MAG: SPOR domain-containing protein [bacterium]
MTRFVCKVLIFFFIVLCSQYSSAQSNAKLGNRFGENWLIGATVGPTFFSGDLNINRIFPSSGDWKAAGSVFFGRQMNSIFTLRGQFLFGKTAGTKVTGSDGKPVNLHFDATLLEGNINTMINFSNLIGGVNPNRHLFLYGVLGIGATGWKTTKINTVTNEQIQIDGSAWKTGAVFPAGAGIYYSIANKVNLGIEWTFRILASDFLDGTAGGYKLDIYDYLSFGITLNLNKGRGKPPDVKEYRDEGPIILNLPRCEPKPMPSFPEMKTEMAKLPLPPSLSSPAEDQYVYKVQIFAFSQKIYSPETIKQRYHIPMEVSREYSGGLYRYIVGSTENLAEAREIRDRMINVGIHDAFIVAYKDNQRMPFMQVLQN